MIKIDGITELTDDVSWFPDPKTSLAARFARGEVRVKHPSLAAVLENGLLATGGDLNTERLLVAYSRGIFPWFAFRDELPRWYCPMDRFVINPSEIHVSHSMRSLLNKGIYKFSIDTAFESVITSCALFDINNQEDYRVNEYGAWLGPDIMEAYTKLHKMGVAHSVEVWNENDELVGGLYGVVHNRCFMGESMFSVIPNGSKMALIHLCRTLAEKGFLMVDCQFETPHLLSMGGRHISYDEYLNNLSQK